jgi:hypothetical protein
VGTGEVVSTHTVLGLGVADDRLDREAAAQFAFDGPGNAASLAGDVDLELVTRRSVVAATAASGGMSVSPRSKVIFSSAQVNGDPSCLNR